jgi:hypothetical protein
MQPIDYDMLGNPIYAPLDLHMAAMPVPIPGVNSNEPEADAVRRAVFAAVQRLGAAL